MNAMDCGPSTATPLARLRGFLKPGRTADVREAVALLMIGEGLIRFIDGALFATPTMDYLPTRVWGLFSFVIGLLLWRSRCCERRVAISGRLVAAIGCGFLVAMASSLYGASAPSAFVHAGAAFVLALEAQVHECQ
jgi:hypothetical protein